MSQAKKELTVANPTERSAMKVSSVSPLELVKQVKVNKRICGCEKLKNENKKVTDEKYACTFGDLP